MRLKYENAESTEPGSLHRGDSRCLPPNSREPSHMEGGGVKKAGEWVEANVLIPAWDEVLECKQTHQS